MPNPSSNDAVVLVHGLASHSIVLAPLARALAAHFARVTSWNYRSLWFRIERHGRALARHLQQVDRSGAGRIHLVTHSMGGIIGRLALEEYLPERFGRFLMIAPPNRGSHVATRFAPYLGRICPPLVQLADHASSFVCSLPQPRMIELGIIAAARDALVRESHTRLGCELDHIVLPGRHSSLLWKQATAEQVRHFLEHGRFRRGAESTHGVEANAAA